MQKLAPPAGLEQPVDFIEKTAITECCSAKCGAHSTATTVLETELAIVVDAWVALPPAIKAGILAMVRASK